MIEKRKRNRLHVNFLGMYVMLLPIATSLSGLLGNISFINYVAVLYLLVASFAQGLNFNFYGRNALVYVYYVYFMMSLLWGSQVSFNWYLVTTLMNMLVTFIALSDHYSERELTFLKKSVVVSFVILFALALMNIESIKTYRLTIKLFSEMDPNDFACGLSLLIALALERLANKKKILSSIVLLLLSGMLIVFSGSRGAMLMFAGMFGVWFLVVSRKRWKGAVLAVAILAIGLVVLYKSLPEFLQGRLDIVGAISGGGSGRTAIWKAAFEKFAGSNLFRMFFGYGYGNFAGAVNYIAPGHTSAYTSHNMFVNALIEGGIIGLTIMLAMFFQAFVYALKRKNMFGYLPLIGLMISGCTLDTQAYRIFGMVFIVAFIFVGGKNERKKISVNHRSGI